MVKLSKLINFDIAFNKYNISYDYVNTMISNGAVCIDYNEIEFVQNKYTTGNSTFLNFGFGICDSTFRKCPKDLNIVGSEVYIGFNMIVPFINGKDYYNPIKYSYKTVSNQASMFSFKRNYIEFGQDSFITDNGWIIENFKTINFINPGEIRFETNSKSLYYPNSFLWITLESTNLSTSHYRSYLKFQNLLAQIGGFVNSLFIVLKIFFSHYLRYMFTISLRENLNPENKKYLDNRSLVKETQLINIIQNTNFDEINKGVYNSSNQINPRRSKLLVIQNDDNFVINKDKDIVENEDKIMEYVRNNKINSEKIKEIEIPCKNLVMNKKLNNIKFSFDYIDFKSLNYFKYLYYSIICYSQKLLNYNIVMEEINNLLDLKVFCSYLKHQYLLIEPTNFID